MSALAVVDHAGSTTVLPDGQCALTPPEGTTAPIAGLAVDGSTLQLQFQPAAEGSSLELTIQLSRGFAPGPEGGSPSPDAESPSPAAESPDGGSPSPAPSPVLSTEDLLPFVVLPELVELSVQLAGQQGGAAPEVLTGAVSPNGLSGYVVAVTTETEQPELVTINFVCAEPTGELVPGASPAVSPGESPDAGESPEIDVSPSPTGSP